jgi:hypothetical protein
MGGPIMMNLVTICAIIEEWLTEFDLSDVRDIMLEFLALIGFLFLLGAVIIAMVKAPILVKHGSIEIVSFVVLGTISAIMDLFDEFAWFTQTAYDVWKWIKDILLLLGAVLLVIGFFRFFMFSSRLFGKFPEESSE